MKITGFRTLVLGTPWRNLTYLILETDEGIEGVGEARVLGKTHTVIEYLKNPLSRWERCPEPAEGTLEGRAGVREKLPLMPAPASLTVVPVTAVFPAKAGIQRRLRQAREPALICSCGPATAGPFRL